MCAGGVATFRRRNKKKEVQFIKSTNFSRFFLGEKILKSNYIIIPIVFRLIKMKTFLKIDKNTERSKSNIFWHLQIKKNVCVWRKRKMIEIPHKSMNLGRQLCVFFRLLVYLYCLFSPLWEPAYYNDSLYFKY